MPELWTPSDELLQQSPIALQKILNPFHPPDLASAGIDLADVEDDAVNEASAAIVLAAANTDEDPGESGDCSDDDDLDDPDDDLDVDGDV